LYACPKPTPNSTTTTITTTTTTTTNTINTTTAGDSRVVASDTLRARAAQPLRELRVQQRIRQERKRLWLQDVFRTVYHAMLQAQV